MSYVGLAIVSMVGYGITSILLKVAMRQVPPQVALVITNTILIIAGAAVMVARGTSIQAHLKLGWPALYLGMAGVALSVSIISYYTALDRGPASIVVPIFALSFAVAAALSIVFLGETVKTTRILGLLMATGAIVLLTR